jgi:dTDP-4-amino-4,6-dideoxygalactose transaminase
MAGKAGEISGFRSVISAWGRGEAGDPGWQTGQLSEGLRTLEFGAGLRIYRDKYCVATSSGTAALVICRSDHDGSFLQERGKVIIPAHLRGHEQRNPPLWPLPFSWT